MAVVVEHRDPAALADELEAAVGALEPRERRLGAAAVDADPDERLERRGGVPAVVLARDGELEVDRLELPAADDLRHLGEPRVDRLLQLGRRAVRRVVVELDVRHDGDAGPERERGAVGLVPLDDEPARRRSRRCRRAAARRRR